MNSLCCQIGKKKLVPLIVHRDLRVWSKKQLLESKTSFQILEFNFLVPPKKHRDLRIWSKTISREQLFSGFRISCFLVLGN